jgi:hypothetical protein
VEALWTVLIDGGPSTQIFDTPTGWGTIDVSSRGQLIFQAGEYYICDLPACTNRRGLKRPANFGGRPRWTPDGQRIGYIETGGENLLSMGLDGGAPRARSRSSRRALGTSCRPRLVTRWETPGDRPHGDHQRHRVD